MSCKKQLIISAVFAAACLTVTPASVAGHGPWKSIFNGKDLTGWTAKITGQKLGEDTKNIYRVEGGMLRVSYDGYQAFDNTFGNLYYNKKLSHYRLKFEYRFIGEQLKGGPGWATHNSGVMVHSQAPETMVIDQFFPISVESQLLGGLGNGARPTGNICTPGTHVTINKKLVKDHCIKSTSKTYDGDQWVSFEIEVRGSDAIRHYVNGQQVFELTDPMYDFTDQMVIDAKIPKGKTDKISSGYITLQAESHNIDFRNIQLMDLKH